MEEYTAPSSEPKGNIEITGSNFTDCNITFNHPNSSEPPPVYYIENLTIMATGSPPLDRDKQSEKEQRSTDLKDDSVPDPKGTSISETTYRAASFIPRQFAACSELIIKAMFDKLPLLKGFAKSEEWRLLPSSGSGTPVDGPFPTLRPPSLPPPNLKMKSHLPGSPLNSTDNSGVKPYKKTADDNASLTTSQQGSLGDVSSNPQSNLRQPLSLGDSACGSDLAKKDDNTGTPSNNYAEDRIDQKASLTTSQQGSLDIVSSNPQSNSPQLPSLGDSAYGSDLVKKDDNTGTPSNNYAKDPIDQKASLTTSQQGSLDSVSSNPQSNSPQLQSLGDSAYGSDLVKKDDNTGTPSNNYAEDQIDQKGTPSNNYAEDPIDQKGTFRKFKSARSFDVSSQNKHSQNGAIPPKRTWSDSLNFLKGCPLPKSDSPTVQTPTAYTMGRSGLQEMNLRHKKGRARGRSVSDNPGPPGYPSPVQPLKKRCFPIAERLKQAVADEIVKGDWQRFANYFDLTDSDQSDIENYRFAAHRAYEVVNLYERKILKVTPRITLETALREVFRNFGIVDHSDVFTNVKEFSEDDLRLGDSLPPNVLQNVPSKRILQFVADLPEVGEIIHRLGPLLGLSGQHMRNRSAQYYNRRDQTPQYAFCILLDWKCQCALTGENNLKTLLQALHFLELNGIADTIVEKVAETSMCTIKTEVNSPCPPEKLLHESPSLPEKIVQGPDITTAILATTVPEFDVVRGYLGIHRYHKRYKKILQGYTVEKDPLLSIVHNDYHFIEEPFDDILHLLWVCVNDEAFVVYHPRDLKSYVVRGATIELCKFAEIFQWPLTDFYAAGCCGQSAQEGSQQQSLGHLILAPQLDDYNQGEIADDYDQDGPNKKFFPQCNPIDMSDKLFDKASKILTLASMKPSREEWVIPFRKANRICSGSVRISKADFASRLRGDDQIVGIEMEGISLYTVQSMLKKYNEGRCMDFIVIKGASDYADRPCANENKLPIQLFDKVVEEKLTQRAAIASLHSIIVIIRTILLKID